MTATRDLSFDTLRLEQNGRVLTVSVFCPPLNFVTMAFVRELDALTSSVDRRPDGRRGRADRRHRGPLGSRTWTRASSVA